MGKWLSRPLSFIAGALLLCLLSALQKIIIDVPIFVSPKGYLVPFLFGGATGLLLGEWGRRLKVLAAKAERGKSEQAKETLFLQNLLDAIPIPVFYKDSQYRYIGCNIQWEKLLGIPRRKIAGKRVFEIAPREQAEQWHQADLRLFKEQTSQTYESRLVDGEGKPRDVIFHKAPFYRPDGRIGGIVGAVLDISEQKRAEREIEHLAYFDALTELPNRRLLKDRLDQVLARARREKGMVGVLSLDLNDFKRINDSFGHSAGDQLLRMAAGRLSGLVRKSDTVARLGNDEFVIILTTIQNERGVTAAVRHFQEIFSIPFHLQQREIHLGCTIGIALFPMDGNETEILLKNADMARNDAKKKGHNFCQFYSEEMNQRVTEQIRLETALRGAEKDRDFFLVYQPQVDARTGKVIGLEALCRWRHPDLGLIPPGRFIPLAEETGLILPLGEWVLRKACSEARKWLNDGVPFIRVAVNLSGHQFRQPHFIDMIDEILEEVDLAPRYLELELTESMLMDRGEQTVRTLRSLKERGIYLSIDDFGTGYSSLAYLQTFPIDRIKVAQSFVRDLPGNRNSAAIVESILAMSRNMDLDVIAEGVEIREQADFLLQLGCTAMQGFHFSKPHLPEEIASRLKEERKQPRAALG